MKKLYIFLLCALFAMMSTELHAIKAFHELITARQPDGTTISIRVHGDEFLNYTTTASGQLIKAGADGYYYYASFRGADIVTSAQRVGSGASAMFTRGGGVVVPQQAIEQAQQRRAEWRRNMTNVPRFADVRTRASNGEIQSLVILVQTSDVKFKVPNARTEFSNMLNQTGYSTNGGTGSVKEYYSDNTMGQYNINFVIPPIITLPKTMAYYATNTGEMIKAACNEAEKAGLNFAPFDNNNDGVVDNVYMFFAGYDKAQGGTNTIWSHASYINNSDIYDGKKLEGYACSSELKGTSGSNQMGIGVFTHEFGHVLGMPDLYDVDYEENGQSKALYGITSLMDGGGYNNSSNTPPFLNAIERETLGVLTPEKITTDGNFTLESIQHNKAYTIETGNKGEYFLIEHRGLEKWDKYVQWYGILIYHIDKSKNIVAGNIIASQTWDANNINNFSKHECAKLVTPSGSSVNISKNEDYFQLYYPGSNNVTSKELKSWSSNEMSKQLTNITADQTKGSFNITAPTTCNFSGTVTNTQNQPIEGVKIIIQKKEETKSSSRNLGNGLNVMSHLQETTKAGANLEVFTDSKGEFSFKNLEKGTYIYQTYHPDFVSITNVQDLTLGDNVIHLSLKTYLINNTTSLSWSDNIAVSSIGGKAVKELYVANSFDAADLIEHKDKQIISLYFSANTIKNNATIGININDKVIFTKNIGVNYRVGFNEIDIKDANILIPENQNVKIWVKYDNLEVSDFPILIDKGPAIKGKGDLYSYDGAQWEFLTDAGLDNNIIIGMNILNINSELKLKKTVLQRTVWLDFAELNPNSKSVRIELSQIGNSQVKNIDCGSVKEFVLTDLTPQAIYSIKIFIDNEPKANSSFALEALKSEYALIYESKKTYATGDKILLDVLNIPDGVQSIKWFVDGTEYKNRLLTLAADTQLKVEVSYQDGSTETLSRKIKVATAPKN